MLIDTHCHLDFDWFDEDREAVVARAVDADVRRIIVPAIGLDNCDSVLKLARQYDSVFAAVGVHPNSSSDWQDQWLDSLRKSASRKEVVAIGEIGLDYYRDRAPKPIQHRALLSQLELAAELSLPVIIHNRESSEDLLRLLAKSSCAGRRRAGVLHSFSGDWETAKAALDLGFYLGFTGPVTYRNAEELRQIASKAPIERILIETDAPFLAPQGYRGKRNEPAYVTVVAERIASVRSMHVSDVAEKTTENAMELFGDKLR